MISIICPTYNEEKYISNCIDSMLSQDVNEATELLFIDGISTDGTRDIILRYAENHAVKLIDNPNKVVPHALNIGIEHANGDTIVRIDAHSIYPKNYISTLVQHLRELKADNVGGVWHTLPANSSAECVSIAIVMSNKFGVGDSLFRVGVKKITEADTVPFGCFNREVFNKIGLFDEELKRNQDDEFNGRIKKNGGKIYLIPSVVIGYYTRDSIAKTSTMFFQYGLFKPLVNKKLGAPATLRQFAPVIFVLGIIVASVLSFFFNPVKIIFAATMLLYLLICIRIALISAFKYKSFSMIFYIPILFFCIHTSYGMGYLIGIYKVLTNKKFNVKSSR